MTHLLHLHGDCVIHRYLFVVFCRQLFRLQLSQPVLVLYCCKFLVAETGVMATLAVETFSFFFAFITLVAQF